MINSNKSVVVIGAGGHAKVVISTLQSAGYHVCAVYDDDRTKWGTSILGVTVTAPVYDLDGKRAVIAIGNNSIRQKLAAQFKPSEWVTVIHTNSYVHSSVKLGPGTLVFAGAVVQPDTIIGAHSIINTGATVDHDCSISDFVHIAPGAHLAGAVSVASGAFLGIGAVVIPCRSIGSWATIGAGAAVIDDVPDCVTVVGVPARLLKKPRRNFETRGESTFACKIS